MRHSGAVGAARALLSFANRQQANSQGGGEAEGGGQAPQGENKPRAPLSPACAVFAPTHDLVFSAIPTGLRASPFEKDGSGWDTAVTGGTRLGNAPLRSSWERLQEHAKANTTDDHEGPKGAGGCVPPPPSRRTTGVGRRGGEVRCARQVPHSAAQVRAWAGGGFDADHGFGLDGAGRSDHQSRARGPRGVGAADACAPSLRLSPPTPHPTTTTPPPPPPPHQKQGRIQILRKNQIEFKGSSLVKGS
jgi:hypothetical protein